MNKTAKGKAGSAIVSPTRSISGLEQEDELSEEEARRFDADFRIVDGGRAFQVACLSEPVQKHVADSKAEAYTDKEGERFCYDIEDLHDED